MKAKLLISLVLSGVILMGGCTGQKPSLPSTLSIPSVTTDDISNPKLALASYYEMEDFSVTLASPSYSLPLTLTETTNLPEIESRLQLIESQKRLLQKNGFVVILWHGDDIVEPYKTMKEREVPIFVTSDTLLHFYHIQFNEVLKRIEEEESFDSSLI